MSRILFGCEFQIWGHSLKRHDRQKNFNFVVGVFNGKESSAERIRIFLAGINLKFLLDREGQCCEYI